ncbi:MAG TPA: hypothetical protein VNS88_00415 [Nitrospiraceae bacterium]|nr:hypothetical protein [Nitrospiraceae bacterium]
MAKEKAAPSTGQKFIYNHPAGLGYGEHHKQQLGHGDQTAEMKEIDLQDGMEVTYLEPDADSSHPIVEWTDTTGLGRITTIDQATFDEFFTPA